MPADISVLDDPELAKQFDTFWQTPQADSTTRMKLFKLAWDMVGSEFAGRHQQYDQAGLMVRLDPQHWLKCGIEYVDGRQCASAVVTRRLS